MTEGLLAHVTGRFSSHPENVAAESLAYILGRSTAAKRAFLGFVEHLGLKITADLVFRPQASGADGSIPDLVGTDIEG